MLIVQPDILYVFYIVINGRFEASGMKSVYCVLSQSSHHNWYVYICIYRFNSTCVTFGVFAVLPPPPPSLIVLLNDFLLL